jgi:DNA-binding NarL/FixJ family response regulator
MINIAIISEMTLVLEGLKLLINRNKDFSVISVCKDVSELTRRKEANLPDVILIDIDMTFNEWKPEVKNLCNSIPEKRIIALSSSISYINYYELIEAGLMGMILKHSTIQDLEKAIWGVYNGATSFPMKLLHNTIVNYPKKDLRENDIELSVREIEILNYICQGLSNKELADRLLVSIKTIEGCKTKLIDKAGVKNTSGLILWSIKNKLIEV